MMVVLICVALGLSAATLGFVLDLRDKVERLLKLPQAQPSKIAGESPKARRERFMQAMRSAR